MRALLDWLFPPREADDLGDELRAALGVIVKRVMREGGGPWQLTLFGCSIRGVPVGDWKLTVERAQAIEARRAATENTDAVADESAVGKAEAPKGG